MLARSSPVCLFGFKDPITDAERAAPSGTPLAFIRQWKAWFPSCVPPSSRASVACCTRYSEKSPEVRHVSTDACGCACSRSQIALSVYRPRTAEAPVSKPVVVAVDQCRGSSRQQGDDWYWLFAALSSARRGARHVQVASWQIWF